MGDYRLLTDLARMTFECGTLAAVLLVFDAVDASAEFELILAKNCLSLAYDADPIGGYRDLLLNIRHVETGHIAEVQITLVPLLKAKSGGYVARLEPRRDAFLAAT